MFLKFSMPFVIMAICDLSIKISRRRSSSTESGFHPIPLLVHETATETELCGLRQRQDGKGKSAPELRKRNAGIQASGSRFEPMGGPTTYNLCKAAVSGY